ncbi:MAG: hypothetical protein KDK37_00500 [Leptospiraceae bacterium]|nr:hypothetical protein [Leptospiraceae bacterium]
MRRWIMILLGSLFLLPGLTYADPFIKYSNADGSSPDAIRISNDVAQKLLETRERIRSATGQSICFVLGDPNYQEFKEVSSEATQGCDGFLFLGGEVIEFQDKEFSYEFISMGYEAMDDANPRKLDWSTLDFERNPVNPPLPALVNAFADRYIQRINHPYLYEIRDLYEEATADYVLEFALKYFLSLLIGLVPVGIYLLYRFATTNADISWRWHFVLAPVLPLILLFGYMFVLNLFPRGQVPGIAYLPMLGCAYAFLGFLATFFLGQRLTGASDFPPYWGIALLYLLAPLAILAAAGAKGAIANAGQGSGGSRGSGSGSSGGDFKGGGGDFGGGGASGNF